MESTAPKLNFFEVQRKNQLLTIVLFFLFFLIIALLIFAFSFIFQEFILTPIIIFILSIFYAVIVYSYSSTIIASLLDAKPNVEHPKLKQLQNIVEELSVACGIRPPQIYVIQTPALNAFASGVDPDKSIIGVTTGLLDTLNRDELSGVVAHELAHIVQKDTKVVVLSLLLVGIIGILSDLVLRMVFVSSHNRTNKNSGGAGIFILVALVLALLAPIFAQLIRLCISRKREYLADATAVQLTRYPAGLASALEKIKSGPALKVTDDVAQLCIHNNTGNWFSGLFSTHPPIDDRISALKRM
jgi:heat shock protein HtpX